MRSLITVLLLVGLVLCNSSWAARGVQAESLSMLGQEEQQSVESVAHDEFAAYEEEAKQIKCKDLGEWSFDISKLPEHLQAIFNSTAPFTPKALDELEVELLKQCDPTAHQYVLRLMEQARDLVAKGQPNRASSLLRGFAGCVKAEGLTDLVIADKGTYKSPLGSMEIPLVPGATVKPGWPHSEVYIGNASLYATGGPFEGYEPMLVDTRILAATGSTIASMACPFIGGVAGGVAAGKGTERIVKTVSAPFFARYHAHVKMGMSFEEFDKHFEEEIINEYVVPGLNTPLKVTYRLRNKHTGKVYSATYDAGDVAAVAGTVAHAVNGIKKASSLPASNKADLSGGKIKPGLGSVGDKYWENSGGVTLDEAREIAKSNGFNFELGVKSRFENARNAVVISTKATRRGMINRIMLAEEIQHGLDRAAKEASRALRAGLSNEQFHAQLFERVLASYKKGGFSFLTRLDIRNIKNLISELKKCA